VIPLSGHRRAVAALSGGVDSAVAALRLLDHDLDIIGVTLQLRADPDFPPVPSPEALTRARAVARHLGIPFHLIDARDAFQREVVDYFIAEYAAGRTPNPCVVCNRFVRFGLLTETALELGIELLATGHYARIRFVDGEYQLLRGVDPRKDQSYFLHALTQDQLARTHFPLGNLTKEDVRRIAARHELPVAKQEESQDVCFLAGGDYREFLANHAPQSLKPGPIRDIHGDLLGEHRGLAAYTIGQRKGLDIPGPEPLYVLALDPRENALIVGPADQLGLDRCHVTNLHFIGRGVPHEPFRAEAQIRYRAQAAKVAVHPLPGDRADVHFDRLQRDITPGQFLVLYRGDLVLGGGIIAPLE
jgi:tRNA-specific 2-thiouridylase